MALRLSIDKSWAIRVEEVPTEDDTKARADSADSLGLFHPAGLRHLRIEGREYAAAAESARRLERVLEEQQDKSSDHT